MIRDPLREHGLVVETSVGISLPGVNRVGLGGEAGHLHGLREGRVAVARLRAELDDDVRSEHVHYPERERDVLEPGRWMNHPLGLPEDDGSIEQLPQRMRSRSGGRG